MTFEKFPALGERYSVCQPWPGGLLPNWMIWCKHWDQGWASPKDKWMNRSFALLACGGELEIVDEWIQSNAFNELSPLGAVDPFLNEVRDLPGLNISLILALVASEQLLKDHTREGLPVLSCIFSLSSLSLYIPSLAVEKSSLQSHADMALTSSPASGYMHPLVQWS